MNAPQLKTLVASHMDTVREFDFENVVLINGGNWDEALAPLADDGSRGSDVWSRYSLGGSSTSLQPSMPGPTGGSIAASSLEDDQLPSPSAAASAASKELFDVDLEALELGGVNDVDALEAGVEEWARDVTAAAQEGPLTKSVIPSHVLERVAEDDGGLASDIEAAKEASLAFSTRIKKRRIRKKSSSRNGETPKGNKDNQRRDSEKSHHSRHDSRGDHKRPHSHDKAVRHRPSCNSTCSRDRPQSPHNSSSRSCHRRHRSQETALDMPLMPEVIGSDDEGSYSKESNYPRLDISAPMLSQNPLPVLLQPAVYDPSSTEGPLRHTLSRSDTLYSSQHSTGSQFFDQVEATAVNMSVLQRARETVLAKLSREFCRRKPGDDEDRHRERPSHDSAAVVASLSSLNIGLGPMPLSCSSSTASRLRDGLFGRYGTARAGTCEVARDSQSALVPLMFSRS
jgi:hypothetical protein